MSTKLLRRYPDDTINSMGLVACRYSAGMTSTTMSSTCRPSVAKRAGAFSQMAKAAPTQGPGLEGLGPVSAMTGMGEISRAAEEVRNLVVNGQEPLGLPW